MASEGRHLKEREKLLRYISSSTKHGGGSAMIEKHTVIDWPPQTMDLNIIEAVCENTTKHSQHPKRRFECASRSLEKDS